MLVTELPVAGRPRLIGLLLLALFITALNAFKPLTVDDSVYVLFANHLTAHPLDPYGFRAWDVQDANTILAPPALLYWWALGVRLFGDVEFAWKLWLFPVNLLLVVSLHALGRRFARGMEWPFASAVALSPTVLPCVNLMLDVPALALSLCALLTFFRACDGNSRAGAIAAGLIAGVAMQTKYTAFVVPVVMLVYATRIRNWRFGFLSSLLAASVFVGWEWLIALHYGDSHFWLGFKQFRAPLSAKVRLVQPLFGFAGSAAAAALPIALASLGRPTRVVAAAVSAIVAVFAFVAWPPGVVFDSFQESTGIVPTAKLTGILFGIIGAATSLAVAAVAVRLVRQPPPGGSATRRRFDSIDGFLVLWLALEVAGYFALSPYPATRRIMGVAVVSLLLTFRLASQTCADRRGLIGGLVAFNGLMGLFLFAVDFSWCDGQKSMAINCARECRQLEEDAKIWYFGNGTFEYYGNRLGMTGLLHRTQAKVASDDWVLVCDGFETAFANHPVALRCDEYGVRVWNPWLPVQSQYQFGNVALTRSDRPMMKVTVYRVRD